MKDMENDPPVWIVTVRCTVMKRIACTDCTAEEAYDDPFEYAVEEEDLELVDWEVKSVKEEE